jgi:polyhydroxyalkanoate synthesis regulator phasin
MSLQDEIESMKRHLALIQQGLADLNEQVERLRRQVEDAK